MTVGKPSGIKQLQNDTGVFFCLTVLRGIYNSGGEAGEELMISTEKFNEKTNYARKGKNNGVFCGST